MGNKTIERKDPETELDKMLSRFQIVQHDYNKNLILMEEISTGRQFTLRQITTNDEIQKKKIQELIQQKLATKYKYLWRLQSYLIEKQKNYCSNQFNAYLLFQTPVKDLKEQILERRMKKVQFEESQIMNVLQSVLLALKYLYTINHPHQAICSSNILINKQGSVMLSDPWLNTQDVIFPSMNHIYLSPEKVAQINNGSTEKIDWFLSDLFSLGMVILQMIYLQFMDQIYFRNNKQINMNLLNQKISQIKFQKIKKYIEGILNNCKSRIRIVKEIQKNQIKSIRKPKNKSDEKDQESKPNTNANNQIKLKILSNQKNMTFRQNTNIKSQLKNLSLSSPKNQNIKTQRDMLNSRNNTYFSSDYQSITTQRRVIPPQSNNIFNDEYNSQKNRYILKNDLPNQISQDPYLKRNQEIKINFIQNKSLMTENPTAKYNLNVPTTKVLDLTNQNIQKKIDQNIVNINNRSNSYNNINTFLKTNNFKNNYDTNKTSNFSIQQQNNLKITKKQINKSQNNMQINNYNARINSLDHKKFFNIQQKNKIQLTNLKFNNFNMNIPNITKVIGNNQYFAQNVQKTNQFNKLNTQQNHHEESKTKIEQHVNNHRSLQISKNHYEFEDNNIINRLKQQQKQIQDNKQSYQNEKVMKNQQQINLDLNMRKKSSARQHKYNSIINQVSEKSHTSASSLDNSSDYVIQEYHIGSKYEGYKKNGYRNGRGIFYYQDGGYYDGQWKNNKMNGYGKLYYNSQKLAYEGEWSMDFFNGYGKLYNDSPLKLEKQFNYENFEDLQDYWQYYEGELVMDSKQGLGTIKISNGQMYVGEWKQNRVEGKGKFIKLNGQVISGLWKNFRLIKKF